MIHSIGYPISNFYPQAVGVSPKVSPTALPVFGGALVPRRESLTRFYPAKPHAGFIVFARWLVHWALMRPLGFNLKMGETDLARLRDVARNGSGVMLVINHPNVRDAISLQEMGRQAGINYVFMGALEVFENKVLGRISSAALQRMGAFSVNRYARDKTATLKAAQDVLREGKHPFLMAPEGYVTWNNRVVDVLKTGAARTAIAVAREGRPVRIVPVSFYYDFERDITPQLDRALVRLEKKARKQMPMPGIGQGERLLRFQTLFAWLVAQRERHYGVKATVGDPQDRLEHLMATVLAQVEQKYLGRLQAETLELRARRMMGVTLALGEQGENLPKAQRLALRRETAQAFEAMQDVLNLSMYRRNYLKAGDQNRLMEMLIKLERDITGKERGFLSLGKHCTVRVAVGEPIDVGAFLKAETSGQAAVPADQALSGLMRRRMQDGVERLADEAGKA